jgi:hypothetical protein
MKKTQWEETKEDLIAKRFANPSGQIEHGILESKHMFNSSHLSLVEKTQTKHRQ